MSKDIRRPFGRMPEEVNKLTEIDKSRAAIKAGRMIGDDDTLRVFKSRDVMAALIRKEERNSPRSNWSPLVKLRDGEGY